MGGDGDPNKIINGSEGKGKGKARGVEESDSGSGGSLLTSMFQNARSSVTPSNLASIATADGKAVSSSTIQTPHQAYDTKYAPTARSVGDAARLPAANGNAYLSKAGLQEADVSYRQFGTSDLGVLARTSSPVLIGPYSSSNVLDAALHRQVQAESSQLKAMDSAWTEPWQSISTAQPNTSLDEIWMQSATGRPAQSYHGDGQRGEQIDALLQAVELSDSTAIPARQQRIPAVTTSNDIFGMIDEEEQMAGTVSPRHEEIGLEEEQRAMHQSLAALQNSKDRDDEKIRPPDDDPIARTGVYAATPEEALRAIWDGIAEGERASATIRQNGDRSESLSSRIREILRRGSYVDDIYGLPPQLVKTIVAAEEEDTEDNKDRKVKAIQRLEALYRHLGAAPSTSHFSIDDYIR